MLYALIYDVYMHSKSFNKPVFIMLVLKCTYFENIGVSKILFK